MARLGIGRTFQNLALFGTMSVIENVMVGGHCRARGDFVSNALRLPWVGREEADARARADEITGFLGLGEVAHLPVASLPFGTQKRVELARALMGQPRLLLLDEPAAGLNHEEVEAARRPDPRDPRPAAYDGVVGRASHGPGDARLPTGSWRSTSGAASPKGRRRRSKATRR